MGGWTKLYLDWRRRRKKLKLDVLTVHERHHRREKMFIVIIWSKFSIVQHCSACLKNVKDLEIVRSREPVRNFCWPTNTLSLHPCTHPQIPPQWCTITWGPREDHRDRFCIELPLKTWCKSHHFWEVDSEILPLPRISPGREWSRDPITW